MALEYLADSTSEEKRYFTRELHRRFDRRYTHDLARQGYDSDAEQYGTRAVAVINTERQSDGSRDIGPDGGIALR